MPALAAGLLVAVGGVGALTGPAAAATRAGHDAHAADHARGPALLPRADTRLVGHPAHGAAAVRALGQRLDDAAARNGMSAARLQSLLEQDHTAWVDPAGRLYFQEAPVPAAAISTAASAPQPSQATAADVFALHSRPGSTHTIYLNFRGMTVSGTDWNTATTHPVPAGYYRGFSLDSDFTTYSSTERADIQEIWERVSAAYAPFDVDVTTQAPADNSAFTRTDDSDTTYGTQVLIDSDSSAATTVCGAACAGVAYVGTFAQDRTGEYSPAWVFPSGAGESITYVAQSVEHEVGHTFGLVHDGIVRNGVFNPYYAGNGLWGPIMGGGSAEAVYQFSKGDYAGAQTEGAQTDPLTGATNNDDLAIIAESAPLLPDDAGDTMATATDLGAAASYSRTGMISTASDIDVYQIHRTCSGTFTASANPTVQNAPLDLSLTLRDSSGATITSADPQSSTNGDPQEPLVSGMGATVAPSLGPGTYYVSIDGVGNASPTQGYSDYGSVGAYALTISGCATTTTTTGSTGSTGSTSTTSTTSTGPTTSGPTSTGPTSTGPTSTGPTTSGPTTSGPAFTPAPAPLTVHADAVRRTLSVSWRNADVIPAGTTLVDWQLRLLDQDTGAQTRRTVSAGTLQQTFTGIPAGHWAVSVASAYDDGLGATATRTVVMGAPTRASQPRSLRGHTGSRGGPVTVRATWWAPVSSGSFPITGYQIEVLHLSSTVDRVVGRSVVRAGSSARAITLSGSRQGSYAFRVRALTAAGPSAWTAASRPVRGR